MMISLYTYYH